MNEQVNRHGQRPTLPLACAEVMNNAKHFTRFIPAGGCIDVSNLSSPGARFDETGRLHFAWACVVAHGSRWWRVESFFRPCRLVSAPASSGL